MLKPQKLTKRQALFVLFASLFAISFFAIALLVSAPKITLNGDEHVFLTYGEEYVEEGAVAVNAEGKEINVFVSGRVDSKIPGDTVIEYSAIHQGRTAKAARIVTVAEKDGTDGPELQQSEISQ